MQERLDLSCTGLSPSGPSPGALNALLSQSSALPLFPPEQKQPAVGSQLREQPVGRRAHGTKLHCLCSSSKVLSRRNQDSLAHQWSDASILVLLPGLSFHSLADCLPNLVQAQPESHFPRDTISDPSPCCTTRAANLHSCAVSVPGTHLHFCKAQV